MRRSPVLRSGDALLTADHEDDVTGSGDDGTKLAPAGGRYQQRAVFRNAVNTAHHPIGRRGELTHLTTLHLAIHLIHTRAQRLIQAGDEEPSASGDATRPARIVYAVALSGGRAAAGQRRCGWDRKGVGDSQRPASCRHARAYRRDLERRAIAGWPVAATTES
jgi:hypothetical protein